MRPIIILTRHPPLTTFLVASGRCSPSADWAMVRAAAWREAASSFTRLLLPLLFRAPAAASLYWSICWLVIILLLSLSASSFTGCGRECVCVCVVCVGGRVQMSESVNDRKMSEKLRDNYRVSINKHLNANKLTLEDPVHLSTFPAP